MKKFLLFFLCLLVFRMGFSQTIFTENFDGSWTLPPTLSPAWSGTTTPANNEWHRSDYQGGWSSNFGAYTPPGANSTAFSARFHSGNAANNSIGELVTPAINLSGNTPGSLMLSFYHINTDGVDKLNVYISDDSGTTWSSAIAPSPIGISTTWTKKSIPLPGNSATTKIKFTGTSDLGTSDIGVDEMMVYVGQTANAAPVNFTATAVTQTDMTIGWTDNSTNETTFRVYRSTDNISYFQIGSDIPSTSTAGTGTTYSQAQTGLAGGVTYYYKIAAVIDFESSYLTGNQATLGSPVFGIKTVGGAGTPDYPTLASAIADLNLYGAGAGGVTFNVAADHTETFSTLTAGLITAGSGAADRPIIFQKSGTGNNPLITGCTTGATAATNYVIALQGSDYFTFNGIDVTEPTGLVEWGYAVLKSSGTDGSQNVTISNCKITLKSSVNINSVGIYSANVTPGAPTTQLVVTSTSGNNSNNKFYSNTITGCYNGIVVNGFNDGSPYAFYDQSNEIGKDGGNTITSPGGSSSAASGILTTNQDRLVIANNTVNGTVANTTGAFGGIQLNTSKNSNVNVYNNTVSVVYNASSGAFYGIYNNMGTTYSNNTANFYNNTVTNCSSPNATTGNAYYFYVNNSAQTLNVYDNNVVNNTYGSASTASTGSIVGFYFFGTASTLLSAEIHGNNFSNFTRYQSVPGSAGISHSFWLGIGNAGATVSVHDNVIDNVTSPTNGLLTGYYFLGGPTYKRLYRNSATNLTTNAGSVYGCYSGEGANQYINNNRFQNLKTLGTGTTGFVYGMYCSGSSGGGSMYVYNNFISELKAPNGSSGASGAATGGAVCGIYAIGGSSLFLLGIYNNTVYLDGTSTSGSFSTAAIFLGYQPQSIDLRNNILVNNCTPTAGGYAVALKSNGYNIFSPGIANFAQTVNNNLLYAGAPGPSNLIAMISNNDASYFIHNQTINDYKTRVWPKECNSITGLPVFVQTAVSPYDIHIDPTTPSICESTGQVVSDPISITSDYDNDARYPNAGYPDNPSSPAIAPDMGADEFAGLQDDKFSPVILYTPLANSPTTSLRELTATITDIHGVPITGIGLPRLAWKIFAAGTWTYVTGESLGNSQYKFTFGEGAHTGDSIYYYVLAQDELAFPNVGTFPLVGSGGFSASPPTASVHPTPASAYKIIEGRCGTLTVGAGQYYPTITAAFSDLAAEGVDCPVVLELTDNEYPNETWPIVINPIAGTSAINTVTLRPAPGITPVIGTSYNTVSPYFYSMISLNGCQYVIFDGSNSGGSDRSMTISNSFAGIGGTTAIGLHNNGIAGAGNITIRNCVVKAVTDPVGGKLGISFSVVVGNGGYHDILITNNQILGAKHGISVNGLSSNNSSNVVVTNNLIGSMDQAQTIACGGIQVNYTNNVLIEGNEIIGPANGMTGFAFAFPAGVFVSTGALNLTIKNNVIHDLYSTAGISAGIYYEAGNTTVTEISNNLIYNIKSIGSNASFTGGNAYGIYIGSGGNLKIHHNSVWMQGNYLSATLGTISSCVNIRNSITNIDFRNNLLKNSSQPISGTPGSKSYCIAVGNSPSAFSVLDYNDYYSDGIGALIGSYNNVDKTTLAAWQSATGQDAHALSVDPVFTSATNLLPTTAAMPKAGTYISSLPTDYAGVTRTNPPDIGAYEFTVMPSVSTIAATGITHEAATFNGTVNALGQNVNTYFDYGLTNSYGATIDGNPFIVSGNSIVPVSSQVTGLDINTTYHFRLRAITFTGVIVYGNDMTFTTSGSTCPMPTGVMATSVTSTTATISWTEPAPAPGSGYEWEVRTIGDPGSGPTGLAASGTTYAGVTSAPVSGLMASTVYALYVRSNCGDGNYSDWTPFVNFATLPETLTVTGVIGTGNVNCYNATNTITVAGNGTTFEVQVGGSATFIAGQKISFLPGTTVLAGGYLLGRIAPDGPFCNQTPAMAATLKSGQEEQTFAPSGAAFSLYPNPTTGNFTLVNRSSIPVDHAIVEVYSMKGVKVLTENMIGQKQEFRFRDMPNGLYFVKIVTGEAIETIKMVKM